MLAAVLWTLGCARPPMVGDTVLVAAGRVGSTAELEQVVAIPLESELAQVAGVRGIRTTVNPDQVLIAVELAGKAWASLDELRAALDRAGSSLPEDVRPELAVLEADERTVFLTLTGGTTAERGAAWTGLREELLRRSGVRSVASCGIGEPRVVVRLDPVKAAALGVSAREVESAIAWTGGLAPMPLAELLPHPIRDGVRLADLATVEDGVDPGTCTASSAAGPVGLVEVRVVGKVDLNMALAGPVQRQDVPGPVVQYRRAPGDDEVGGRIAAGVPGAVVLDERAGVGRVLGADAAAVRAIAGVTGAWDSGFAVVRITGPEPEVLDRVRDAVATALEAAGTLAVPTEAPPRPSIEVEVDRERAADLGVDPGEAARALAAGLDGVAVGRVTIGDRSEPVRLVVGSGGGELELLTVPSPHGTLPLSAVATLTRGTDRSILRVDGQRALELAVTGSADLAAAIAQVPLPPGYRVEVRPAPK